MNNLFKKIPVLVAIYFFLRIFSYFFPPDTPLYNVHLLNTIISGLLILVVIFLFLKKQESAWYIVAGELILGGSGNFFAFFGVSLRTIFLIISIPIFFILERKNIKNIWKESKRYIILLSIFYTLLLITVIRGYVFHNNPTLIIADLLPYLFLLYYFPLRKLLLSSPFIEFSKNVLYTAIIGNFTLIFFTFFGFSTYLFSLQGEYYHWFRDIANGKITDVGFNFFRVVINEHLLLTPLFLLFFGVELKEKFTTHKKIFFLSIFLLCILAISLTRIYFIAIVFGIFFFLHTSYLKRWFKLTFLSAAIFIVFFVSLHTIVSKGQSLGLELFGLRIQSIITPNIEDSALSRMLLLPKIFEKIKNHPILGNGLGSSVTVYSPVYKKEITTNQFDWGYLEILTEQGVIGFLLWCFLVFYTLYSIKKIRKHISLTIYKGLFASILSLLVINTTSPALFHGLGILFLTYILSFSSFEKYLNSSPTF